MRSPRTKSQSFGGVADEQRYRNRGLSIIQRRIAKLS
jgi:hypothetical protein